ncbi:MAG: hypothetical protein PHI35_04085 [Victivallaceae bacterium]|nr:hypothetical protein [Victivallaceae bacterium]
MKAQGREIKPQDAVEAALLRRALGFQQEELHIEETVDRETGTTLTTAKRRRVVKEIVPDVRALLFWLKNRKPERWREKLEVPEEMPDFDFDSDDVEL